ncbi:1193_t:CDS:2 [Cetraspora pellucida]|uniref:1193_t:CDS:1 n=1 Tax=Cetraspora pellucida TaxID=1433469 RepID=A0ACA9JZ59_9GLOM|nr:1193_t:CDS:2 [Cetraspora pellucida]
MEIEDKQLDKIRMDSQLEDSKGGKNDEVGEDNKDDEGSKDDEGDEDSEDDKDVKDNNETKTDKQLEFIINNIMKSGKKGKKSISDEANILSIIIYSDATIYD